MPMSAFNQNKINMNNKFISEENSTSAYSTNNNFTNNIIKINHIINNVMNNILNIINILKIHSENRYKTTN